MMPLADYHMHTPLCGHAEGEPEEYAFQALKVGLQEIGFSDHAPMVHKPMPGVAMDFDELPLYHKLIERTAGAFQDKLRIKIGLEADFIPGCEDKTRAMIEAYPYDYIIGSVHFIGEWGFDHPDERDKWSARDVNQVYREYYRLLRESAMTGLFDIIAHSDLVKKFGHRASEDMTGEVQETARVFREAGVAVEINTSGLRKPVAEMYPTLENLKIFAGEGIPLTFGSDSHRPEEVGRDFDKALVLAREAGYKEYVLFKSRAIERRVAL